jgi:3-isopropylmalate/(R)-2-methylmalate dehydratase small subunit
VNQNFGCRSSREHAPQALVRWGKGIAAIVGESFAEIFHGNCVALGVPCVIVDGKTIESLMAAVEKDPKTDVTVDLEGKTISAGALKVSFTMAEGPRKQFLEGRWDSTAELLANADKVRATAGKIPYFQNFS